MTKTKATLKMVYAKAIKTGVEIEEDRGFGSRSWTAWSPAGKKFTGSTCHVTCLGDYFVGEKPNWNWMLEEIELDECDEGVDCEYCHPELNTEAASSRDLLAEAMVRVEEEDNK